MHDETQKLETLFHAAREFADPDQRAIYLREACGGDPVLKEKVEALLRAAANAEPLFEAHNTALDPSAPPRLGLPIDESVGTLVGPYKLLQKIGEGGMGVVYMAEQTKPVTRKVALKIIKLGMDTRQVVARFEAERQALALMDHPNIARVLDAGATGSGRPYFVMELVQGVPITDYCDQANLSAKERLTLFIQVCQAVQSAHQKGIIHRDLKPTNILVTLHHGAPMPKIIDFGIAKATEQKLTEKTLFTQHGAMIGTPAYMSPEQAEMSSMDVDTRSDIYSLGVLLYELLTGSTPFPDQRLRSLGYGEMQRVIVQEEPELPSTRLSTLAGEQKSAVARHRSQEVSALSRLLRGDLDWVVMRCLEKNRTRRYETANGLAADIQRHLSHEPVVARPPSLAYLLQKAWRRNKLAYTAGAAVAVTVLAGLILTTWQAVRATRAERGAIAQRERADGETQRANRLLYDAHMNLVQAAWEGTRVGAVLDLLKQHEPKPGEEDHRGFEWHYWDRLSHGFLLELEGHAGPVTSVAYSPDGKRLASADRQSFVLRMGPGQVKVWDATTGQELLTLKGHKGAVNGVAFSPDGMRIASAGGKRFDRNQPPGEVKVWDATTGSLVLTLPGHGEDISSLAFSPDGKRLVSASDGLGHWTLGPDGRRVVPMKPPFELKVWDAETGDLVQTLKGHGSGIRSMAFSPDGKRLASASNEQTVKVWDLTTGAALLTLRGHTGSVACVTFSPDGTRLASAGEAEDRTVKVWDAASGQDLLTLRGHAGAVRTVAFSPDGNRLVSGSEDQTVKEWDVATGRETRTWRGHAESVTSVAFSPDGNHLASGSDDRTVKVWDLASSQETNTLRGHNTIVACVAFHPDGRRLASACSQWPGGELKIWDPTSGKPTLTWSVPTGSIISVAFSPDGKRLASAGFENGVQVWDATTGHKTLTLPGHASAASGLAFSPDGTWLASGSENQTVKVWDAVTGQERVTFTGHIQPVRSVAFSPDGRWLASGSSDLGGGGEVKVWNIASGQQRLNLGGHASQVWSVAFSPDGKRLATASEDRTVKVWDVAAAQEVLTLRGHTGDVKSVVFSPDGQRLVSASDDKSVKLWDAFTGQETLTLKGHTGRVTDVAFSRDGTLLASSSWDQTVRIWRAQPRSRSQNSTR